MENKLKITKEGLLELKKELRDRLSIIRDQIAEEIRSAREQGDLSENSAYKAAMDKKEFNENRILDLELMIKNSVVIEEKKNTDKVQLGDKIKIKNTIDNKLMVIELVGASEADPANKKISNESPLGMAIINKKKGSEFKLDTPNGVFHYIIVEIN